MANYEGWVLGVLEAVGNSPQVVFKTLSVWGPIDSHTESGFKGPRGYLDGWIPFFLPGTLLTAAAGVKDGKSTCNETSLAPTASKL